MKKIAVFVEGQAELITVREFLLKKFMWEVNIRCLELRENFSDVPIRHESQNAKFDYQIFNIGNDNRVLSTILKHEEGFFKQGFVKLIGLRDMFSEEYRNRTTPPNSINSTLNQTFIQGTQKRINDIAKQPEKIKLCFAIMEIETWYLGMYKFFERSNPAYTDANISAQLGCNIAETDPETTFFHPSATLNNIFSITGNRYEKHAKNIETILAYLEIEHFEELYNAAKCASFNTFLDEILIPE